MVIGRREINYGIKTYREEGAVSLFHSILKYGIDKSPLFHLVDCRDIKQIRRDHDRFINTFFDSRSEYDGYIKEWQSDPLRTNLKNTIATWEAAGHHGANNLYYLPLYAYIRKHKPKTLVETGVKDGWATLYTLSALEMNCKEEPSYEENVKLYSIDLSKDEWSYRTNKQPAWILPANIKNLSFWELLRGSYQRELLDLLNNIDGVDIFNHDSEHTVCNMIFEFELAALYLNENGILVCDNIYTNDAFDHFTNCQECSHGKLDGGSHLDEYWWTVNTDTDYPNAKKKPKDNIGIVWNLSNT